MLVMIVFLSSRTVAYLLTLLLENGLDGYVYFRRERSYSRSPSPRRGRGRSPSYSRSRSRSRSYRYDVFSLSSWLFFSLSS